MSKDSREQRRAEARAQREAAERAAVQSDQRRKRLAILGAILAGAVAVVVAVVLIAGSGGSDDKSSAGDGGIANAAAIQEQLGGVPQNGNTLGKANAPITIVEYGDLQCPVCANFSNTIMPSVVQDDIRTGKARMQFRNFAFIGDDSNRLALASLAAGEQDKQFNFNELVYANQGEENSGYATDDYIRGVFAAIPGLDVDRAMKDMDSQAVADKLDHDMQLAQAQGIDSTPTIFVGRSGQTPTPVNYPDLPAKLKSLTA